MAVEVTIEEMEGAYELPRRLVGRHAETRQLESAVEGGARSIALFGPPGVGKTALAWNFFSQYFDDRRSDRVVLVDGTGHEELAGLIGQMASRLGVDLGGTVSIREVAFRLGSALEHREVVGLILDRVGLLGDDLEPLISQLLETVPELRILITAQKRPGFEVDEQLTVEPLGVEQAVELFARWLPSAGIADLSDRDIELIETLVDRLDRLPLAIRLAANRYELMGGESLLERLDAGLEVLEPGGPQRERRGLQSAIEWSWQQLEPSERALLEQCSVFSGFFPLAAAESVVDFGDIAEVPSVVDVVESLVHRSLLRTRPTPGDQGGRLLGLYRSVRKFARNREEWPDAERRHAEWFVDLEPGLYASTEAIRELAFGQQDLERIVERFDEASPELALRALLSLDRLYGEQGFERRHRELIETGEQLVERVDAPRLRGRTYWQFGLASMRWGDFERADDQLTTAYEITSKADDGELATLILVRRSRCNWRRGKFEAAEGALELAERNWVDEQLHPSARAEFHGFRGGLLYNDRRPEGAADQFRRARELYAREDRDAKAALSEARCAMTRAGLGALDESRERFTSAISTLRDLGAEGTLVGMLNEAAYDATIVGALPCVVERLEEALDLSRKMGRRVMEGRTLNHLGIAHANAGRLQKARRFLDEARAILEEADDYRFMSEAMLEKAFVLLQLGDAGRARQQLEQVTEIRDGYETDVRWCIRAAQWSLAQNEPVEASDRLESALEVEGIERFPLRATRLCAWSAIAHWKRGRRERAGEFADRARGLIDPVSRCTIHGLVRAVSGWVDQMDFGEGDWEEWMAGAQPPDEVVDQGRDFEDVSIELRFLRRLYRDHLAPAESDSETGASCRLDIGPECRWFTPPGGERVELDQRKVLRNLLECLVQARVEQPGEPVDIDALIAAGWPDQKLVESAGQNRVYVSISKLRKVGLDDLILTGDKAYYLDPEVPIRSPFS